MQKITTNIFIIASILFGLNGLLLAYFGGPNTSDNLEPNATILRIQMALIFIILPSFALSVAQKYLK